MEVASRPSYALSQVDGERKRGREREQGREGGRESRREEEREGRDERKGEIEGGMEGIRDGGKEEVKINAYQRILELLRGDCESGSA